MSRNERADNFPPDLVSKDEAIDLVIDALLMGSRRLGRLSKKILKAQERLQHAVDADGWRAYLLLEELVNERVEEEMHLLVRWALGVGARSRR